MIECFLGAFSHSREIITLKANKIEDNDVLRLFKSRRKKNGEIEKILTLPNDKYVKFITDLVSGMEPAEHAFIVVAYQNMGPYFGAIRNIERGNGRDYEIEDYVKQFLSFVEDEELEINRRRFQWFVLSGLVARLSNAVGSDSSLIDEGGQIWVRLLQSMPYLRKLLPHSVIWNEDEKSWFYVEDSDQKIYEYGIELILPKIFRKSTAIKQFIDRESLIIVSI